MFWRVRTLSGSSLRILRPKPKRCLCSKSGKDKKKVLMENERFLCSKTGEKKKGLHPKSINVCARKGYCCNFVIKTYVCARIDNVRAQQIYSCAQSLKSVREHTRTAWREHCPQCYQRTV